MRGEYSMFSYAIRFKWKDFSLVNLYMIRLPYYIFYICSDLKFFIEPNISDP